MDETSLSLLNRLHRSPDSECWNRMLELYAPLIKVWLRKYDVQACDADDLMQEVLLAISKDLGKFEHSGRNFRPFNGGMRELKIDGDKAAADVTYFVPLIKDGKNLTWDTMDAEIYFRRFDGVWTRCTEENGRSGPAKKTPKKKSK